MQYTSIKQKEELSVLEVETQDLGSGQRGH
jgi:hypothetical protein